MAKEANAAAVERIKAARQKSLKLMQMDMDGSLKKIAESNRGTIENTVTGPETNLVAEAPQQKRNLMPMQQKAFGPSASKLPSKILESFKKNPIGDDNQLMREVLAGTNDVSFLDEAPRQAPRQRMIVEEVSQPQMSTAGIDYPMIRTIVEEIVRKYAGSITKKVLSESKQSGASELNTLMIGKKFKFLANNGDIYECTMRKVSNINSKKREVTD